MGVIGTALLALLAWSALVVRLLCVRPSGRRLRRDPRRRSPALAQGAAGETRKICVVLGSGGHTAEMLALLENVDLLIFRPRLYFLAMNDPISEAKARVFERERTKARSVEGCDVRAVLGIRKIHIIYVESLARVRSLSLSGKILYPWADRFIVQWEPLAQRYQETEFYGCLV
ncbi:MAG: UDP-N-acetylglucosamine transferase subunit ALG14 [Olpidium bornovanus]|uniref:UDP-N-acetylglucosamine transferase subunit ALG14 n=1 Tax=Olpidium bornovanus TaxID=278681 RepID=A0A8H7ZN92_9FUNG|nr:MAG: UDP-N-acetylglucosamine transferase subunit ALG14 [Olpidium bornovanus]